MRERQRRPPGNRVGLDTVPGQKRGARDGTGAYRYLHPRIVFRFTYSTSFISPEETSRCVCVLQPLNSVTYGVSSAYIIRTIIGAYEGG